MKTRLFMMLMALFVLSNNNRVNAQEYHYDVNNDGDVNITDAILLVNYILGKDNENVKPDTSPAEAIDLGLPSGTKWASCNVGATKPEEYGGYYAWGETEEKETYSWENYIHCDGRDDTCHDLGSDIGGTEYDVAHVRWGGNWLMPTLDDIEELLDNCTDEWTTLNGVKGMKFTSNINGNNIFLPAVGDRWVDNLYIVGEGGYYWSSTQNQKYSWDAHSLYFRKCDANWYYGRCSGRSVRPVIRK